MKRNHQFVFLIVQFVTFNACVGTRPYNDSVVAADSTNSSPFNLSQIELDGTIYTQLLFSGLANSQAGALMQVLLDKENEHAIMRRGDGINFDILMTGSAKLSSCSQRLKGEVFHYSCDLIFSTEKFGLIKDTVSLDTKKRVLTLTGNRRGTGTEVLSFFVKHSTVKVPNLECRSATDDEQSAFQCVWGY